MARAFTQIRQFGLLGVLLLAVGGARASEDGRPLSRQFLPEDYHGFEQVWDFAQTPDGLIYATNYGALREYDGREWRSIPLPTSWVFKVTAAPDGRLYIAAFDEIGYVARTADGRRAYHSLVGEVPAGLRPVGQANGCVLRDGAVFWSTPTLVLRWDGARMRTWAVPAPSALRVHAVGDDLLLEGGAELYRFDATRDDWTLVSGDPAVTRRVVTVLASWAGGGPVIVRRDGVIDRLDAQGVCTTIASVDMPASTRMRVMDARVLGDGRLALATTGHGLIVLAPDGAVDMTFGTRGGIASSDLQCVFEDRERGLWLGSNHGIARVEPAPGLSVFDRDNGAPRGVCYTLVRHGGVLFGAGEDGLFRLEPGEGARPAGFVRVGMAEFTVNMAAAHPAGLLVATDTGLMRQAGGEVVLEFAHSPSLHFVALSRDDPDLAFIADSHHLRTVRWDGAAWRATGDIVIAGYDVRSLVEDADGSMWIGTPTRGVVRLRRPAGEVSWRDAVATPYDTMRGLPAGHEWTSVRSTPHGLMFVHARGVSMLDTAGDRLVPAKAFDAVGKNGRYVYGFACAGDGTMWVQLGDPTRGDVPEIGGVAPTPGGGWTWVSLPAGILRALGYLAAQDVAWEPAAGGAGALWLPGQKSLVRVDLERAIRPVARPPGAVVLRDVTLGHGRRLPIGDGGDPVVALDYTREALRFQFACPAFGVGGAVEFQFRLAGFDEAWSPWMTRNEATYTNLPGGRFRFEARARLDGGGPGPVATWAFEVRPPWWLSVYSWFAYAAAAALALTLAMRWRLAVARRERLRLERLVGQRTDELAQARDRAEQASEAKTMFLARMSHELRTPLHAILGYARMLAADPTVPGAARDRLRIVRASGQHLLRLINEVLDLSKIEAGKQELRPEAFDLAALLLEIGDAHEARAMLKSLAFVRPASLPARHVLGDAAKLRQVLENLLGNAIKFTAAGEVGLAVEAGPADGRIRFAVRDTGPGIDPAEFSRLFQPFTQTRAGERTRESGTGLGLAISQRLVALMGGRLEVDSVPGRGSTFFFDISLPAAPSAQPARRERAIEGYDGPRRHVLAVDDVEANRALFVDLLTPLGFSVATAVTAEEALEKLETRRPDLLLLDLRLPGMDGFELARRIRRDPRHEGMKILAASASVLGHDPGEAVAAGCDGFIPKPFLEDDFLARVGELLGLTWRVRAAVPAPDDRPLDPALLAELDAAARTGDVVGMRAALARLRERHEGSARIGVLEAALADFDIDRLIRLLATTPRGATP